MTRHVEPFAAWMNAGFDMWMLGLESSAVISLRMALIAAGGRAGAAEADRMVSEKLRAAMELQIRLLTGFWGRTPLGMTRGALSHYRDKVAANERRLSRARARQAR